MLKKIISILLVLAVALSGGCWDARDIEDMDICTAVVVDYYDGEYAFYCEIINVASQKTQEGGGQGLSTSVIKGAGDSFAKARHDLDRTLNKPLYLGAVQSLVMTEEMTNNVGIEEYAYRVRELHDYRKTMDMIITPDKPEDILAVQPENAPTVGFTINDTLQNLLEQGVTFHVSLADVLQKLCAQNKCYLLTTLGIRQGQIVLLGYTVFDGGQRMGFIPYDESRGIVFVILGGEKRTPKFLYALNVGQEVYSLEATLKKSAVKAKWDGSRASFTIDMDFEAKLMYQSVNSPATQEIKRQIKEQLTNRLMEEVTQAIQTSMDYGCDYLYFSEPFRVTYPRVYEQMDWHSTFKNADFAINLTVSTKEHEAYDYSP